MRKKILFVINTMGRAGAEQCLLTMLNYMDKEKYDISLLSVINRGELFGEVPEGIRVLNEAPCRESVLDKKAKLELAKQILRAGFRKGYFLREAKYFWKVLRYQQKTGGIDFKKLFFKLLSDNAPHIEEEYDLAVGYIQGAATYYVMDYVRAGNKVLFLHNEFLDSGYCPELEKPYYEKADAIYCVSQSICNHFKQVYPGMSKKMEVFYNLLNKEEILEKSTREDSQSNAILKKMEEEKKSGKFLLCTAARLTKVKAYDIAVPALSLVIKQGYNVVWYVLGEGEERGNIEKLVCSYGLEQNFFLLGAKENPYPYMAACDIYVQATRYEGYCTAVSEAVILGKPLILSDCGGNREQLEHYQAGILVELQKEKLAEGIIRMVENGKLREELIQQTRLHEFKPEQSLQRLYQFTEGSGHEYTGCS